MLLQLRQKDTFFFSNYFLLMHLIQNMLFWVIILSFSSVLVLGCEEGHDWAAHIAFILYLLVCLIFDGNFIYHYVNRNQIE